MVGSAGRWRQVDEVLALALETPPEQRSAAVERACRGDDDLRREVERLLEADEKAHGFLETPAAQIWLANTATAEDETEQLAPGHRLAGRYQILSLLGRGGMGAVYRAQDTLLGSEVAVKVLDRRRTRDAARLEAFVREVRVAREVSHRNVCRVHDIGDDGGAVFLSMEYVEGETLALRIQRLGALDPAACRRVLCDVARGLAAAHAAGVVHRDLKPENVLLRARSDEAVVADFGIAARLDDRERPGWIVGTRGYMSPEQLTGGAVDARSDVYALGILARQMTTGRPPEACREAARKGGQEAEGSPASASPLAAFASACLMHDPADRPADAAAALALIEASIGVSPEAPAVCGGEAPAGPVVASRSLRGRLPRMGVIAAAGTLLGAGIIWLAVASNHVPAAIVLGPVEAPAGTGDAAGATALRALIRDELIDGWGVRSRLTADPAASRDEARITGCHWREGGRLHLQLGVRCGWYRRTTLLASADSLRELAERSAALVVESCTPPGSRRPRGDELRAVGAREPEAWRLLRRARRAARAARWSEARHFAREAIDRDPGFALAWLELAFTFNDGDAARNEPLGRGLALARGAKGLNAGSAALVAVAHCWRDGDMPGLDRALRHLESLALEEEDQLYARARVAMVRFLRGDSVDGLARMEWIAERWPDDAAAHKLLADYHLAAGEMGQLSSAAGASLRLALRHAERSVALAPYDVASQITLARALLLSGDLRAARLTMDTVALAGPEEKQAASSAGENINNLFALHMALADWDEAGADARRMLLGSAARRAHGQLALGYLDLNRGRPDRGLERLRRATEDYFGLGLTIVAAEHSWELCCHAMRFGCYGRAHAACARARQWSRGSSNVQDARRERIASIGTELAAAQTRQAASRRGALRRLRGRIARLAADDPLRGQLELMRRHALGDWAGVIDLYDDVAARPDTVAVAYWTAEAFEHLGRSGEARRVDERYASHPNAWRYPNPRVTLGEAVPPGSSR